LLGKERDAFSSAVTYGYLPDYCTAVKAYRGQIIEKSSILKCGPHRPQSAALKEHKGCLKPTFFAK